MRSRAFVQKVGPRFALLVCAAYASVVVPGCNDESKSDPAAGGPGASGGSVATAGGRGGDPSSSGGSIATPGGSASGGHSASGGRVASAGGSASGGHSASGGRVASAGGNENPSASGGRVASAGGSAGNLGGANGGNRAASGGAASATGCDAPKLVWKSGNKTNYTSYPDPGSEECVEYNGCTWAGQFAACDGKKSEQWVSARNIAAVFPSFSALKLHDLCLRKGTKTIVVTVLDTCGDSDCDGCCTRNKGQADALIDLESYTNSRWGVPDGPIEWADLGPTQGTGCN